MNGCVFCASVHARFAAHYSKRADLVDLLLAEGDLRRPRRAVERDHGCRGRPHRDAARVRRRRTSRGCALSGLDDLEIADVVHGAAFFNWANRLMLSLGRPVAPAGEA